MKVIVGTTALMAMVAGGVGVAHASGSGNTGKPGNATQLPDLTGSIPKPSGDNLNDQGAKPGNATQLPDLTGSIPKPSGDNLNDQGAKPGNIK
ncbi:hypothetical protein ADK70_04810 [Streptomyces rimosus subsp. pseudoverticillatus]|nr:hypothetical protein ADK70_04810 [Streptomyces rimosus subsp. pseudoverticillatus]